VIDQWTAGLWTQATRNTFLTQAEEAMAELRRHVELVAESTSADEGRIEQSAVGVIDAFAALADAEWNYSSTLGPFSDLDTDDAEEETADGEEKDETEELAEHPQVSVMLRHDYLIRSEKSIFEAGRAAYLRVWAR
jgi:hypothetical protein